MRRKSFGWPRKSENFSKVSAGPRKFSKKIFGPPEKNPGYAPDCKRSNVTFDTSASNPEIKKCEEALQPYLNQIYDWTVQNDLKLNPLKSAATLFTIDQSELKYEN